MTTTTKAALAAELGISRACVSQYVRVDLPTLPNGKLNREAALRWISRNIYVRDANRGAHRAWQLVHQGFAGPDRSAQTITAGDLEEVVLDERELARGG